MNKKDNIDRAFRTVDVDLYNEDNYKEENDGDDAAIIDANQINSLLSSNKNVDALKLFLSSSPTGVKDPASKKAARDLGKIAQCPCCQQEYKTTRTLLC